MLHVPVLEAGVARVDGLSGETHSFHGVARVGGVEQQCVAFGDLDRRADHGGQRAGQYAGEILRVCIVPRGHDAVRVVAVLSQKGLLTGLVSGNCQRVVLYWNSQRWGSGRIGDDGMRRKRSRLNMSYISRIKNSLRSTYYPACTMCTFSRVH